GEAIAADVPLSFWGGFNPDTGEIIDQRHPLVGSIARGRVLVVPAGRGSCSSSGVLLEAIRNGTAPTAIITSRIDPIIGLGGILGDELYASHPVIVVVNERDRQQVVSGDWVAIDLAGRVTIKRPTRTSSVEAR
ncbi:MAG: aconitase X swivel domain-containing protein, partial [Thermomicrobiales bacterium]